jgi:hypothetical protein
MADVELPVAVGDEIVVRMRVSHCDSDGSTVVAFLPGTEVRPHRWVELLPGEYERAARQALPDRETLAKIIARSQAEAAPLTRGQIFRAADAVFAALREWGMG